MGRAWQSASLARHVVTVATRTLRDVLRAVDGHAEARIEEQIWVREVDVDVGDDRIQRLRRLLDRRLEGVQYDLRSCAGAAPKLVFDGLDNLAWQICDSLGDRISD